MKLTDRVKKLEQRRGRCPHLPAPGEPLSFNVVHGGRQQSDKGGVNAGDIIEACRSCDRRGACIGGGPFDKMLILELGEDEAE